MLLGLSLPLHLHNSFKDHISSLRTKKQASDYRAIGVNKQPWVSLGCSFKCQDGFYVAGYVVSVILSSFSESALLRHYTMCLNQTCVQHLEQDTDQQAISSARLFDAEVSVCQTGACSF